MFFGLLTTRALSSSHHEPSGAGRTAARMGPMAMSDSWTRGRDASARIRGPRSCVYTGRHGTAANALL